MEERSSPSIAMQSQSQPFLRIIIPAEESSRRVAAEHPNQEIENRGQWNQRIGSAKSLERRISRMRYQERGT